MTVATILAGKGGDVITATPSTTLEQLSNILAEHRIGAIVILESDKTVCGIASERDVVRQIAKQGSSALNAPISVCMTKKVISCTPDSTINDVMGIMSTNKFRHLPVITNGKLEGIISIGDVVKKKIEQSEREAEELKQYIAG
jgi:CBS domain-containing protein